MSNPNEVLNEFLAHSHSDTRENSPPNRDSRSQHSSRHQNDTDQLLSDDNNEGDYDYEKQDFRQSTSSARPTTSYIPQYSIDGVHAFPIQEVVPNTQVSMSTGADHSNGNGSGLRPRGQTVTANVLNIGDFYGDMNNQPHTNTNTNNTATSARGSINTHTNTMTNNTTNNGNSQNDQEDIDDDEPINVPMMVKPKTLYQNPQTPTVLPSTYHPINKWSSVKHSFLKEFLAEFMGTMVMILFGAAVCCQVNFAAKETQNKYALALSQLAKSTDISNDTIQVFETLEILVSSTPSGTFDDIPLGWGAAVIMGYFAAGGSAISGAHLNPAITITNYVFRGFPAKKIPFYIGGQMLGAFVGALICFILYKRVIIEAYTDWHSSQAVASNFITFPKGYLSSSRQFTSEFIATAAFQASVFAMTDPYTCLSTEVYPLMLFILIFILNASMGYQTACAINMARDLGPRLALYAVGFERKLLWDEYSHYFWVPIIAPQIGSLVGALVYDICIYQGHESPVNWPLAVYKDMILNAWFRRPGWKRRNRARATSDLSEFSFPKDDDDDMNSKEENNEFGHGILKKGRTRTKSSTSADSYEEAGQKTVSFKSVQRGKRGYGGIPTILEEEDSIETTSLRGETEEESISLSDISSLPDFVPRGDS